MDYQRLEDQPANDQESTATSEADLQESLQNLDYRAVALESKKLLALALPVMCSYILSFVNVMMPLLTLGHIGTKYLAAISLTTMTANITGFSIGQGIATAMDTLCSQAYTGSEDQYALGKHLQRSVVVMLVLCIPISAAWLFTEQILLALGQDPEVSRLSGIFILYLLPGLFPYLLFQCVQKYLQAQGIMQASFYITLLLTPLNVFLQYYLVSSTPLEAIGAPLAISITNILLPAGLILYTIYIDGYQCWDKVDYKEAFDWQKIKVFLKLGIPGVIMLCAEWWAFEIVALLAGLLGDEYLAAQSVMLNTSSLCYMVSFN
jgi:multidrug resistance protein, MATE family